MAHVIKSVHTETIHTLTLSQRELDLFTSMLRNVPNDQLAVYVPGLLEELSRVASDREDLPKMYLTTNAINIRK